MAKKFATVPLLGHTGEDRCDTCGARRRIQVTSKTAPNPALDVRANMDAMGRVSLESIGAHSSGTAASNTVAEPQDLADDEPRALS